MRCALSPCEIITCIISQCSPSHAHSQDPLVDLEDDALVESAAPLGSADDQLAALQRAQDASALLGATHFVPAFQYFFTRRCDGLYNVCTVTQRTYIPADLHFHFYEPVSASEAEVVVPESAFDELRYRMGAHAKTVSPYVHREEWASLLLRLFSLRWEAASCSLVAALDLERVAELPDLALTRDAFSEDPLLGAAPKKTDKRGTKLRAAREREVGVYVPMVEYLEFLRAAAEQQADAQRRAAAERAAARHRPAPLDVGDDQLPVAIAGQPEGAPIAGNALPTSPKAVAATPKSASSPPAAAIASPTSPAGPDAAPTPKTGANLTATVNVRTESMPPSAFVATAAPTSPARAAALDNPRVPPLAVAPLLDAIDGNDGAAEGSNPPVPETWGVARDTGSARLVTRVTYDQGGDVMSHIVSSQSAQNTARSTSSSSPKPDILAHQRPLV